MRIWAILSDSLKKNIAFVFLDTLLKNKKDFRTLQWHLILKNFRWSKIDSLSHERKFFYTRHTKKVLQISTFMLYQRFGDMKKLIWKSWYEKFTRKGMVHTSFRPQWFSITLKSLENVENCSWVLWHGTLATKSQTKRISWNKKMARLK